MIVFLNISYLNEEIINQLTFVQGSQLFVSHMSYNHVEMNNVLNAILLLNNKQQAIYNAPIGAKSNANYNKRCFFSNGLGSTEKIFIYKKK